MNRIINASAEIAGNVLESQAENLRITDPADNKPLEMLGTLVAEHREIHNNPDQSWERLWGGWQSEEGTTTHDQRLARL